MKIKTILIFAFFCNTWLVKAQEQKGKVWITVDDISILPALNSKGGLSSTSAAFQKIVNQFDITNVVLAFPASKSKELRKVYEIQCNCNQSVLSAAIENAVVGMRKPQEAPVYELMYSPNDYNTLIANDYALNLINAQGAWDISHGDPSIVIGISDSNYDTTSTELGGKLNYIESGMTDPNIAHGTQVAITAAGNTNNGIGKSSIGFDSHMRLYSIGFNQILQASYDGVRVINMSWASGCSINDYSQSVIDEIYANGTILVAAAGNGGTCGGASMLVYPAAYNHVISVTSIGADDKHERLNAAGAIVTHQHNEFVDISSPGYMVGLITPSGAATYANGTSFASPLVTGTIALMLAVTPCLNAEDVEYILKTTATNIDGLNPAYVGIIGTGRLNAQAAVAMAKTYKKLSFSYSQTEFNCISQVGTVAINTIGGTSPYTVTWPDGSVGSTMANLAQGSYTISVVDSSGCFGDTTINITNLGSPALNYDYLTGVQVTSSTFSLNDLNGDGVIKIKGDMTIDSGVSYSIESKSLEFGASADSFSGILIENNATLSISKSSSLKGLSACKSKWEGIVIADNSINTSGVIAYDTQAGRLILDKVNIYDANIAVKTKEVDPLTENGALKYGTYKITNSVFTNNAIGLKITSSESETLKSEITKNIFVLEDSTLNNPTHIILTNVDNLEIFKNTFFGNDKVNSDDRGTGIKSTNSNLFIAESGSTDLLNLSSDGNHFYNLANGIQASSTDSVVDSYQITGCFFSKVNEAISLDKFSKAVIYKNEFDVPMGTTSENRVAIKVSSNSSMVITDNLFTTTNICPIGVYAVIMEDSDTNKMDVYRNKFEGSFTAANLFRGNNLKTFIDCNSYTGNNDNHWVVSAGKLGDQSGVDINGQSLIYKNEFGICYGGAPQIVVNADALGFVYQSKAEYMPILTTETVIQSIITKNAEDNQCRNFFDPTIPTKTIDEVVYGLGSAIFPNPTVDKSAVTWNKIDIDQILIYNSNGELISNVAVSGPQGIYEITNLASGVYFVKLAFKGDAFRTEKLVVSH